MVDPGDREQASISDEVVATSLARASLPGPGACEALASSLGGLAVVDLETTGLDPATAKVVEIGAVILRPGLPARPFHRFVDPRSP
ncbi:MAG: exonuclease domain-containing protein, partial [Alphaproteobacteria bacterium]